MRQYACAHELNQIQSGNIGINREQLSLTWYRGFESPSLRH